MIPPFTLQQGSTYTFRIQVENSLDPSSPGVAYQTINVNSAPKFASLYVNPTSGITMTTQFSFKILGCIDGDLPLQYQFLVLSSLTPNVYRTLTLRSAINTYEGPLFKLDSLFINAVLEGKSL